MRMRWPVLLLVCLLLLPQSFAWAENDDAPLMLEMQMPDDLEPEDSAPDMTAENPGDENQLEDDEKLTEDQEQGDLAEEELPDSPAPPKKFINKIEEDPELQLSIDEDTFLLYANFLRDELKLNDAAISGVMANIQQESGFDPNKIGDMGFAYGLLQWRGPRLDAMVEFCMEEGLSPISVEGQLHFLKHEMTTGYKYAYDLLLAVPDTQYGVEVATYDFCYYYEAPSDIDAVIATHQKLAVELIYPVLYELWDAGKY